METILKDREKKISRVLIITLIFNWLIAFLKLGVGHYFQFLSITSSGLESLFDGAGNILGLISIVLATRPPDSDHNYGHQKYEDLGGLVIAILLIFSSFQIAKGVFSYISNPETRPVFGMVPLFAVLFSLIVNGLVSWYERKKGKEYSSPILIADSTHTFGDFLIGICVLVSIVSSKFGYIWPDLILGGLISFYLFFMAIKIFRQNLPGLLDESPILGRELFKEIEKIPEVVDIHKFRGRGNQHYLYIDFHLHLSENLSLKTAHQVGKRVEGMIQVILKEYSDKVDVTVHIEPFEEGHQKFTHQPSVGQGK